jgi:cytochrome c
VNRRTLFSRAAAIALSLNVGHAIGQEVRGTRQEAKRMADAALEHISKVGFDKALSDFAADKANWLIKDIYVVVFDFEGKCLSHGVNDKLIGKNMLEVKDQRGRFFVKDFIGAAKAAPESWVKLDWAHPVTKKPEPKTQNTRRVPGKDAVLVVGYYD